MHVVVVRSMDEVVLQFDQIDKVYEADEVMETACWGEINESMEEVVLQVDQIDKFQEADELMDEKVLHVEVRLMS